MGKVKQNKKKNRHKPTGMISVEEAEQEDDRSGQAGASLEDKTLPILEKLNCLEDRAFACAGLANLVLESDTVPSLMKNEIVRRVAPLILDKEEKIQEAATGILRNLSLCGLPNICEEMLQQDLMTPVIYYIKQFSERVQASSGMENKIDENQSSVHEQVMHLLLNLSENASQAIKKINDENVVPILTTFLDTELFDMRNVLLTAQCLATITEDNPMAATTLADSKESLKILEKNLLRDDTTEELVLLKVHMAGVLFNIAQSLPSHIVFEMFQAICSIFGKVLGHDVGQDLEELSEAKLASSEECTKKNGKVPEQRCDPDNAHAMQRLHNHLEAQKLSLEILTNMCCSGDMDDQNWEEVSSDEHSAEEYDCCVDTEDCSSLSEDIVSSVLTNGLPTKVLEKCSFVQITEKNGVLKSKECSGLLKIMETIQTRALVCLNNMLSSIDSDHLGGADAITQLWSKIIEIAFQNNDSATGFTRTDNEFIEAATSALRSVLEKISDVETECVTADQVKLLCHLCGVVKLEPARVNLMNVLGIIGKMVVMSNSTDVLEHLQCIGIVLRDVVTSGESLWVIAEALDAIFDLFADNPTADVAAENIGLLTHLEKVVPVLKSRVRKERSTLGDRIPIVNTARTNLVRFIKYKKQIS
ncbi:HEAT repeat-containing protein 3-like isoform X2 [Dendronephthya gigantea]|uniref:HEAT repeat-containing protein 3-like isoform X2 n=1 Tax=Dendronephthya gigantea TaxID=151771 RepID=UPI00106C843C|nr:HEAT repeat-containing protein 3-like isoform X2 [Dendronephthya gigantea]